MKHIRSFLESWSPWEKRDPLDYWRHEKKSDNFTELEREKIRKIANKFGLTIIEWSFGHCIRIEKRSVSGPHNVLWSISINKIEDEWFWVHFNSIKKVIENEDEDFYKADQIDGLINLLNWIIEECQG